MCYTFSGEFLIHLLINGLRFRLILSLKNGIDNIASFRQSNMLCSYGLFVLLCSDADARGAPYDVEPRGGGYIRREPRLFNPTIHLAIESMDHGHHLRNGPTKPIHPPSPSYSIPSTQVATVTLPFAQIQLTR